MGITIHSYDILVPIQTRVLQYPIYDIIIILSPRDEDDNNNNTYEGFRTLQSGFYFFIFKYLSFNVGFTMVCDFKVRIIGGRDGSERPRDPGKRISQRSPRRVERSDRSVCIFWYILCGIWGHGVTHKFSRYNAVIKIL